MTSAFLTNTGYHSTFYHSHESTALSIKEVQDENLTLINQHMPAIIMDNWKLIDAATTASNSHRLGIIEVSVNEQSLTAHAKDISTNKLLLRADLLA